MASRKLGYFAVIILVLSGCLPSNAPLIKPVDAGPNNNIQENQTVEDRVFETLIRLTNRAASNEQEQNPVDQSLNFFEAVKSAVHNNPKIERAKQQVLSAGFGKDVALSGKKIQITSSSGLGFMAERKNSQTDNQGGATISIQASLLLFDGGALDSQIDAAEARILSSKTNLDIEKEQGGYEASTAWIKLWSAQKAYALFAENEDEINAAKSQLETLQKTGILDIGEFASIQGKMNDLELTQRRIQQALDLAQLDFEMHFGTKIKPKDVPKITSLYSIIPLSNYDPVKIPSVKKLLLEHALAAFRVQEAKAALKPKVSSLVSLSSPQSINGSTDARASVFFDYTIGDGGNRKARIAAAEADFAGLDSEISYHIKKAQVAFGSATAQLTSKSALLKISQRKIKLLEKQIETAVSQRALGQAAIQKVFALKIEIFEAKMSLINLNSDTYIATLDLQLASGQLLQTFEL